MLLILDRVLQPTSPFLMSLTSLILWLSLHTTDGLLDSLFELKPRLNSELSRLHGLCCDHIDSEHQSAK